MSTISLTDDVLVCIFEKLAPKETAFQEEWKENLTLLSVCSQWRKVALPLVYYCIGIYCDNTARVVSTASSVSTQNIIMFAKVLDIYIDLQTSTPDFQPVLGFLSAISPVWPGIATLVLNIGNETCKRAFNKCDTSQFNNAIRTSMNSLVKLLPNIIDLQFTGQLPNKESTWLLQKISKRYVKQIKKIKSEYPIAVAGQHYFTGLTHLNTGFNSIGTHFQINTCVDSLEQLIMRGIPNYFDWSGFSKHVHPSTVLFPKLKTLTADYSTYNKYVSQPRSSLTEPLKLHFPLLRYLFHNSFCDHYPVLEHGVFDSILDHMHLSGTDMSLSNLISMDFPETKSISLNIHHKWRTSVTEVVKMISIVAAHARYTRHIKLEISESMNEDMPCALYSEYITHLVIGPQLNAAGIVNIINGMPNLIELDIESYTHDITLDDFCNGSDEHDLADNSKLEILKFNYHPFSCTVEYATQFLMHMLLGLPNLKIVVADNIPNKDMTEFIQRFNDSFPHLLGISYTFKD